ncbi:MAG: AAA domain-containing protein, partial [Sphaerospermopsis sp. SIO1G2]|nr:AAA domain-containing protein [Sphaerospermopsis sp. SIO1G2]
MYPFTAIVGQDNMRLALILNAINPAIGGVLIRGEKGTGKSTAVRALAQLLPQIDTIANCPYPFAPQDVPNDVWPHTADLADHDQRIAPLVNLPLGVTEDRLLGTLDLESVLQRGEKHFEAGLLAQAHQGILYIDEVNLLGDHVVDVLLDAAAMGVNRVEREGISVQHPARFMLVGTMNPEEGDLRPQLLDRFGLAVEVAGSKQPSERAEIVRRRLAFDADPQVIIGRFA